MLKTAAEMSLLSALVYKTQDEINTELLSMGWKDWYWFDQDGTQAFVLPPKTDDNRIIICFRGTEPTQMTDVMADLKAWPKRSKEKGLVHFGFVEALDCVYAKIEECLERISLGLADETKVICTGHSLGAAVATICASRIDAHELYTFGSPRVGNASFIKEMKADNIKHYRFVNNNDVVTKVPFAIMGYKHGGELQYINHYGNIRKMTPWQRTKDQWRGRLAAWKKRQPFDGVMDHNIGDYHEKIKNVSLQGEI
jgi:triacylglycerol lipase